MLKYEQHKTWACLSAQPPPAEPGPRRVAGVHHRLRVASAGRSLATIPPKLTSAETVMATEESLVG